MYDEDNDVERMLREDSRDKKKVGRGVFNRASRRGYLRGGLKTQVDFMTAKERKKLNGKVTVSNMYEKYKDLKNCDLQEILNHENNEVKNILTFIKANHTSKATAERFGVSSGKLYSLFNKYGVEYNIGRNNTRNNTNKLPFDKTDLVDIRKFKLMDVVQKGQYLIPLVEKFNVDDVAKHYDITRGMLYYYIKKVQPSGIKSIRTYKPRANKNVIENVIEEQITIDREMLSEEIMKEDVIQVEVAKIDNLELENKMKELETQVAYLQARLKEEDTKPKSNGLKVELNGIYSKLELENRLLSIATITTDDKSYKVNISLEEVATEQDKLSDNTEGYELGA